MRARACLGMIVLMAWSSAVSAAPAGTTPPKAVPAMVAKVAKKAPAKTTGARAAKTNAARTGASAPKPKAESPRTLQDIHIEGEIPVPQVLFITARDQRRFLDLQHRRYLKTSQQVDEQTVFPSWIGMTGNHPTPAGKENPQ